MKVLFFSNCSDGFYFFRREVVEAFIDRAEVFLCMPEDLFMDFWKRTDCTIIPISFDRHGINPFREIKLLGEYIKILKTVRPDHCFTYTIKPNVYGGLACQITHIPYTANITGLGNAIENPSLLSRAACMLYKLGLRGASKVFFQNQHNCDFFLSHGLYHGPYDILPGSGVNLTAHPYEPYPESQSPVVLSVVGRILKDKGIDEILEASKQFRAEEVRIRLIGTCEEDDYQEKIRKAEEDGVIEYVGEQIDINKWYKESHAILHASYHEGMSNVLLEAAACGRPVLASDIPGCREIFDEGVSGFGFPPKNAAAIADVIRKFLSLPLAERERMGKKGREKVEKYFSRDIVVRKYLEMLN